MTHRVSPVERRLNPLIGVTMGNHEYVSIPYLKQWNLLRDSAEAVNIVT